eukprot:6479331-Amphidinium_carterae.1
MDFLLLFAASLCLYFVEAFGSVVQMFGATSTGVDSFIKLLLGHPEVANVILVYSSAFCRLARIASESHPLIRQTDLGWEIPEVTMAMCLNASPLHDFFCERRAAVDNELYFVSYNPCVQSKQQHYSKRPELPSEASPGGLG